MKFILVKKVCMIFVGEDPLKIQLLELSFKFPYEV